MTEATELDRLEQAAIGTEVVARETVAAYEKGLIAAHRAYEKALIAAHPIKVGDILRADDGTEAKVNAVYVRLGWAQHTAVLRKKDGSWGLRPVSMWDVRWKNAQVVGHE